MSQELPVDGFNRIKNASQFNKGFLKNHNEDFDKGYFLEVDVQYPEYLLNLHNDSPFLPERMKTKKVEKLAAKLQDKR